MPGSRTDLSSSARACCSPALPWLSQWRARRSCGASEPRSAACGPAQDRHYFTRHRRMAMLIWRLAAIGFVAAVCLVQPATAQTGEEFYRGKQIPLVIGLGAGETYDLYARLLAR